MLYSIRLIIHEVGGCCGQTFCGLALCFVVGSMGTGAVLLLASSRLSRSPLFSSHHFQISYRLN